MKNTITTHFTSLPNEIVLIIWKYLTHPEAIKSFGSMKCGRYIYLLEKYCYTSIDFHTTSLSTFRLCCTFSLSLLDVLPQLKTLVLRNIHESDTNELASYLSTILFLEKFVLIKCSLHKISKCTYEHLLNNSIDSRLKNCILHDTNEKDGFFLEEPISSLYQPQHSLVYLRIDVRDFASLKYLLMFLPKLSILDIHLGIDVTTNDQHLFPLSFNPCPHLTKLILRLRHMVVQDFTSIVKFTHLFRNSLITLHMALIHQHPNVRNTLTYIDGDCIFKEIILPLTMMKEFSFLNETTCLCNQQMNHIIRSFQTTYWLNMRIGCHYDNLSCVYVIFTLPYIFDLPFIVMNDMINTKFNQMNDRLECLIPMLYHRSPRILLLIDKNELLCEQFLHMLTLVKSIKIKLNGVYRLPQNNNTLLQFDRLEIQRCYENQPSDQFFDTTKTWLNWMPHLRI
ncbi:hypothetical protein I4U23_016434 [Adineta vaga]|nr:hypothetical protein I4U23_016434 [Adineta vaga]